MWLETDAEVNRWVYGIVHGEPCEAGGFLQNFAAAVTRADPSNYSLLRPVILALKEKYPKYRCTCEAKNEVTDKEASDASRPR